jgi:hypothetical protein
MTPVVRRTPCAKAKIVIPNEVRDLSLCRFDAYARRQRRIVILSEAKDLIAIANGQRVEMQ